MRRFVSVLISTIAIALVLPIRSQAEEFYLPEDVIDLADKYGTEDIPSELIQAVIYFESRGRSDAVSADGNNIGLMQLHVLYFTGDLFDKENNVEQGSAYLRGLYERYGSIEAALMTYHGEGNVLQKVEEGNISGYAKGIIELQRELMEEKTECLQEELPCTKSIRRSLKRSISTLTKRPERSRISSHLTS